MPHEHDGHRQRMRERYLENGLEGFAPHEVLELLLFFGIPRQNVNTLAHRVLEHFGSLSAALSATPEQLMQVPGIGIHAATLLSLFIPVMRYAERSRLGDRAAITNYREAKEYCKHLFSGTREEVFYVICVDAQGRVIRAVPAIHGTIDEITVYPRTIFEVAIRHNAHSVLLAHNHPSGTPEPSDADISTTDLLAESLGAFDIKVLDHIIYADGECVSMEQWRSIAHLNLAPAPTSAKAAEKNPTRRHGSSAMREADDETRYAPVPGHEGEADDNAPRP